MSTKKFKPVTPGTRFRSVSQYDEITRDEPEKSLLAPLSKSGGRNHHGVITARFRGGGAKQRYRVIDFARGKLDEVGTVVGIEYDDVASYVADQDKLAMDAEWKQFLSGLSDLRTLTGRWLYQEITP